MQLLVRSMPTRCSWRTKRGSTSTVMPRIPLFSLQMRNGEFALYNVLTHGDKVYFVNFGSVVL